MKLRKLLKLIPDEYKIGITDYGEEIMFVSYGTKYSRANCCFRRP